MSFERLDMSLGEAIATQRSIRRFRPDPVPIEDLRLCLEAAVRAPNGANRQLARFLVITDRATLQAFGALYREAWWAKRREELGWLGPEDVPPGEHHYRAPMALADHMVDVPCVVLAFAGQGGPANTVIPACQNFMLAARALGLGTVPTTLHPSVMGRVQALLGLPPEAALHFCIPVGYPAEGQRFGGSRRRPSHETTYLDRWGTPVPWT